MGRPINIVGVVQEVIHIVRARFNGGGNQYYLYWKPPTRMNELNDQTALLDDNGDKNHEKGRKPQSLIDPSWELIDPNPDARILFLQYNDRFFWGKLSGVEVRWSPRMTLCAGVCVYEGRGGLCSVRLSLPLLKLRPRKDLVETLLHEMIHAYLFVTDNNKDHDGHGPEFHKHMDRINANAGTKISVYHTFHDEVDHHRKHWWKCDGTCQKRPPYFGFVKRAMNRAPSARDPWWNDHQRNCGGTYTKVKEPEGYGQKKSKKKDTELKKTQIEKAGNTDIRSMFSGKNVKSPPGTSDRAALPALPLTKSCNIAGFVKGVKDDELAVYKDNAASDEGHHAGNYFPGKGKTLATSSNWKESPPGNLHIVRKLPGIGVLTNARPLEKPEDAITIVTSQDDSDEDILIYSPARKQGISERQNVHVKSSGESNIRLWMKSEHKQKKPISIVDLSDSDDEFNELLSKAKPRKKSSTSSLDSSVSSSFTKKLTSPEEKTRGKKVSHGFQSVCIQNTTSDSKKEVEKKVYKIQDEHNTVRKQTGYTAQRNKRAHDLGSSSSDSDIDAKERLSLISVMRRKRKKSMAAEPEISDKVKTTSNTQGVSSLFSDNTISSIQRTSSFKGSSFKGSMDKEPVVSNKIKHTSKTQGIISSFSGNTTTSSLHRTSSFTGSSSKSSMASAKGSDKSATSSQGLKQSANSCSGLRKSSIVSQSSKSCSSSGLQSEPQGTSNNEGLVGCPVCKVFVEPRLINEHLDSCLS